MRLNIEFYFRSNIWTFIDSHLIKSTTRHVFAAFKIWTVSWSNFSFTNMTTTVWRSSSSFNRTGRCDPVATMSCFWCRHKDNEKYCDQNWWLHCFLDDSSWLKIDWEMWVFRFRICVFIRLITSITCSTEWLWFVFHYFR